MVKTVEVNGKLWNKESIKKLILENNLATERAILAIYNYQTVDEKEKQETSVNNGVGFNGVDAFILSSFAEWLLKGRRLSPKQLAIGKKKMPKYAGQILKIMELRQAGALCSSYYYYLI